ncbi:hypothetical protein JTE88_08440 [Arcanobacterium phocisimile]|uniref:Tight adherence protein B n=1 Tax=Arcanobacterium phocisimile TaxID=1302235 RepID=A0ABX7IGK6_9ACTO|nr:hypothetical protein [Arcanobacterium phocisimile]QRV02087.1 hypothetical protein JTE88_08440 [Arcanobacterium phocisimile]
MLSVFLVAFVSVPRVGRALFDLSMLKRSKRAGEKKKKRVGLDMGMVVAEVATRLRSGASLERAWEQALEPYTYLHSLPGRSVFDDDGVAHVLRELSQTSWWYRRRHRIPQATISALPAVFLVCRMSHGTGAPVADVFDACALGITEAGEAVAARDIAMAGPQTSAVMLACLPVVGLLSGRMLGADPLGFFVSSIFGALVLASGLLAEALGVWWVWCLVVRARRESEEL